MVEFFIVLFFGSLLLIRNSIRNVKEIKHDRELNLNIYTKNKETERWISEVCDEDLYEEIKSYVHDLANMSEVRKVVRAAFDEAGITSFDYDEKDAIRVYLAQKGKLSKEDAQNGISVWYRKEQTVHDRNEAIENRKKFAQWIDSKLKECGINEDMFLRTGSGEYFTLDNSKYIPGRCVWRPTIYPNELENVNKL